MRVQVEVIQIYPLVHDKL